MTRRLISLVVVLLVSAIGCARDEPLDERAAALALATDLFEADWSVSQDHDVRLNYRSLQRDAGEAVARVSMGEIRHTKVSTGGALIVSYHVYEDRWQAFASFFDTRAGLDEVIAGHVAAEEEVPVIFTTDPNDLDMICYVYRPDRECTARSDNVVIQVLTRPSMLGDDWLHESRWLALTGEHLRNVRSGNVTTASPLPTVPPTDPFDR
ncbi:MAG: hypothetical protein ACLGHL_05025 [Actinomycetota bacterium]